MLQFDFHSTNLVAEDYNRIEQGIVAFALELFLVAGNDDIWVGVFLDFPHFDFHIAGIHAARFFKELIAQHADDVAGDLVVLPARPGQGEGFPVEEFPSCFGFSL